MSYVPPCASFDILSLFPPTPMGGLCFEEDGEPDDSEPEPEPSPEPEPEPDGKQTKGMQAALVAERKRAQAAEAKLAAFEAAQRKREEEAAAKRGEYEQLYGSTKSELEAAQARLAELETKEANRLERLTASNVEALKALPENLRALVPDTLSEEDKAAQIAKLKSMVDRETPRGGVFAGGGAKPSADAIPSAYLEQANREASRYGLSPENYWKFNLKPRLIKQGKLKA